MQTFLSAINGREITQSLMAITLLGAIVFLSVTGQTVPDTLQVAFATVLGFFFGAKVNGGGALG